MNRFFLLALWLIGCGTLSAQITVTAAYFPEPGDTLYTVFDDAPTGFSISAPGGNQVWDFSQLQNDFTRLREVKAASEGEQAAQFPGTEILFPQGVNANGYYNVTPNRYELVGYAGQDPAGLGLEVITRFSPPYVERWAPLQFFDVRSTQAALLVAIATADIPGNIFDGLPISPDSIRLRVAIQRTDVVDGWGTVTIPGNHSYPVLREKRTEYRDVRLDAKISPLPWFDITDIALQSLPLEDLGRDTILKYYFWTDTPGIKEAVMVITLPADGSSITDIEYKGDPLLSSTDEANLVPAAKLMFWPNPAAGQTQVRLPQLAPGSYTLQLFATDGRLVSQTEYQSFGQEAQTEPLLLQGLAVGTYHCRLLNSQGEPVDSGSLVIVR